MNINGVDMNEGIAYNEALLQTNKSMGHWKLNIKTTKTVKGFLTRNSNRELIH